MLSPELVTETPRDFRKWRPKLSDAHTVHGASYVRPPAQPIKLDRLLADGEAFEWRGRRITSLATPGHSPGARMKVGVATLTGKTVSSTLIVSLAYMTPVERAPTVSTREAPAWRPSRIWLWGRQAPWRPWRSNA